MEYLLLIVGIALLVVGGDFLVKSAVGLANKFNLSPLLIGITIVSFGTSAPELIVSIQATLEGSPGIAIGNIIGSNIANVGLVLGLTVSLRPVIINRKKYFTSWLIMFISSLMFYGFSLDGEIGEVEGLFFLTGLLAFITISISSLSKERGADENRITMHPLMILLFFLLGALGLYFGSELLIANAVKIAYSIGVSEFIIGATVVALGTSLPELATSLIASFRGQNSISIGNLLGSNVFNIFAVIGITSLVQPIPVDFFLLYVDIPVMIGIVIMLGLFMFIGKKIGVIEGIALITAYVIYISYSLF
ncbi:sodium:calcium antiporter [Crocinitomicaceae bacterium]|nr:sodium:calcium antiporter [Crocinitomicaceae bacterium]